jgi:hypothetical protein
MNNGYIIWRFSSTMMKVLRAIIKKEKLVGFRIRPERKLKRIASFQTKFLLQNKKLKLTLKKKVQRRFSKMIDVYLRPLIFFKCLTKIS